MLLHDGKKQDAGGVALKRFGAGRHLVERDAEREQIGPSVHGLAQSLLGRHVRHGAEGVRRQWSCTLPLRHDRSHDP